MALVELRWTRDSSGVLWTDNPPVRFRRPLAIVSLGLGIAMVSLVVLYVVLVAIIGQWDRLQRGEFMRLLALAAATTALTLYRHFRPTVSPASPSRVGVSPAGLHLQGQKGAVEVHPWWTFGRVLIVRDRSLSAQAILQGQDQVVVPTLHLDLASKIRFAHRMAWAGALDPRSIAHRNLLTYPVADPPPVQGHLIPGATPPLELLPDQLVARMQGRAQTFPRWQIDAYLFRVLGTDVVVVTAQGHQFAVIGGRDKASPLLQWLGWKDWDDPPWVGPPAAASPWTPPPQRPGPP